MSRTSSSFKQTDVTRAVKGARKAGLDVGKVEIDATGKIVVFAATAVPSEPVSELDKWTRNRAR